MRDQTPDTPSTASANSPAATLAQSEAEGEGRIGYGRYARYSPLALGIVIVLAVAVGWWWQTRGDTGGNGFVGKPAPDVTLTTFNGNSVRLADLKGSVVVVNFWAAWCPLCKEAMPAFQNVYQQTMQTGEQVVILGVDLKSDRFEDSQQLLSDLGITYITGYDGGGDDPLYGPIEQAFGVPRSYPVTVFIRPDGVIDSLRVGIMNVDDVRASMKHANR